MNIEMTHENIVLDIICQVLVERKSTELIFSVLDRFLPNYQPIDKDYTGKPNDETYQFRSEYEMIGFYVDTLGVEQSFYWNKKTDNPDEIMVGVNIMKDNQIVFSLTFNGTEEKQEYYFNEMKKFLDSEIGVVSHKNPSDYESGSDFKKRYDSKSYT